MSNKSGSEIQFIKKLILIIFGLCAFLFSANKMIVKADEVVIAEDKGSGSQET